MNEELKTEQQLFDELFEASFNGAVPQDLYLNKEIKARCAIDVIRQTTNDYIYKRIADLNKQITIGNGANITGETLYRLSYRWDKIHEALDVFYDRVRTPRKNDIASSKRAIDTIWDAVNNHKNEITEEKWNEICIILAWIKQQIDVPEEALK